MSTKHVERPPRDNLVRAMARSPELRACDDDEDEKRGGMPTMTGHFAVFNQWTEINSMWEGRFMERIAPGAFKKTIRENKDAMRVLFNHGQDFQIGDKVLGAIDVLREDEVGPYYEVPLFNTSYNRDLQPGLEAEVYGASFRFRVMKEEFVQKPQRSDYNPEGIPERTIKEAQVMEFGPVTFPAYAGATAGVRSDMLRSLTDSYVLGEMVREPEKLEALIAQASQTQRNQAALTDGAEDDTHSDDEGSRELGDEEIDDGEEIEPASSPELDPPSPEPPFQEPRAVKAEENQKMRTIDELRARDAEIQQRFVDIHNEYGAAVLPDEVRAEWESLIAERNEGRRAIADFETRTRQLAQMSEDVSRQEPVSFGDSYSANRVARRRKGVPDNVFAVEEYRSLSSSFEELRQAYRDGAATVLDRTPIAHPSIDQDAARADLLRMLDTKDSEDGTLARRIIVTGNPTYQRAWSKTLKGQPLSVDEQRALSLGTDSEGGFAVPYQLDPTVILTSNGVINPIRQMARVERIVGKEWQGLTTDGVTVTRAAEEDEATDDAPTFAQPTVRANRVQGFIPFSVELGQDWGSLQSEMAVLLADAKDTEEATGTHGFILGDGLGVNAEGVIGALDAGSNVTTIGNDAFAVGDVYKLEENVPARFRARAQFLGNKSIYNLVRQFDTGGGAALWERLGAETPGELIGYPARECSTMASAVANAAKILLMGDFRYFLIVDRIGMSVELIPHLFGAGRRPTGQRGIYAIWRNNSKILVDNAFRLLVVQ